MLTDSSTPHESSPNAVQVRDAYLQLTPHSASASGSNSFPLPSPEQLAARRLQEASRAHIKRGRKGYIDCGGYMVPRPPAPPIEGRESGENRDFADELRLMLSSDRAESNQTNQGAPAHDSCGSPNADVPTPLILATERIHKGPPKSNRDSVAYDSADAKLEEAFRNEYYRVHRSGHQDYGSLATPPAGTAVHPWLDASKLPPPTKKRVRPDSNALTLPGIDSKRQRNRYGRGHAAGQETGVGVIGSCVVPTEHDDGRNYSTQLLTGPHGCDGPSYSFDNLDVYKQGLNPDMPPLAAEHPARVWNSLIQSLSPDAQPIIKWAYEKAYINDMFTGWTATLSLALPPSHLALGEHPLKSTLPKNQYAKEYLKVVELLGGLRTWTGDPRRLKADATNVTLVKCMGNGALEWLRAPASSLVRVESEIGDESDSVDQGHDDDRSSVEVSGEIHNPDAIVCDDFESPEDEASSVHPHNQPATIDPAGETASAEKAVGLDSVNDAVTASSASSHADSTGAETADPHTVFAASLEEDQILGDEIAAAPLSAYDELVKQVEAAKLLGYRASIKTVITTRRLPPSSSSADHSATDYQRYGAFIFLEHDDRLLPFFFGSPDYNDEAEAVHFACADGLSIHSVDKGLESFIILWSVLFRQGPREALRRTLEGLEDLLQGERHSWSPVYWMRHLIEIMWESSREVPVFNGVFVHSEGQAGQRGRIQLGAETVEGPFVPMTSDWAALPEQLEYSWASASRDILSRTIDVDYDKIDIGQLR